MAKLIFLLLFFCFSLFYIIDNGNGLKEKYVPIAD